MMLQHRIRRDSETDILTGVKYMPFAQGVEEGLIRFVGDDCKNALYEAIESRQVRPGLCKTAGLKLVYSPLNGSGLVPGYPCIKKTSASLISPCPGAGVSERILHHLQLSEPGNLCCTGKKAWILQKRLAQT